MKEEIAKQIDEALKYYGVYYGKNQGKYLNTVDRLSVNFEGNTLSIRVSSMMKQYYKFRGVSSLSEAIKLVQSKEL